MWGIHLLRISTSYTTASKNSNLSTTIWNQSHTITIRTLSIVEQNKFELIVRQLNSFLIQITKIVVFFQPPLCNHGNILAHLVYVIYSIKSRFCHWGIRKGHNLWVWLCNQSQPGVHCVLCLLGEEVILADYHGTPCCCYTEAELWGSHGSPLSGTRLLLLLSPLSLQLLHKYLMVFKRWGMRQ